MSIQMAGFLYILLLLLANLLSWAAPTHVVFDIANNEV